MRWREWLRVRQSWIVVASLGGLLIGMMVAGIAAMLVSQRVNDVAQQALRYDVQIENRGDDLRAATLDLRHYHRNIFFAGPSRGGIADFDAAYHHLLEEIDRYERLNVSGGNILTADELRGLVNQYYRDFRPAIDLYDTNPSAFGAASDEGLIRLDQIDRAAIAIDRFGEQRAALALANVERASRNATIDLLAVVGGLVIFGLILAYLAYRTANQIRQLYADQQEISVKLINALQAKNDFIADASHELRTPLTVLRGNAEVGLELERDCVHRPFLEDIVKESVRMSRLVEDLLFLARSDSDTVPLETGRFDAETLLRSFIEPAEFLARQNGATLDVRIKGDGDVEVDSTRIEQAVLILVDNATKYDLSGSPISLSAVTHGGELVITVTDHGPGIPDADLPYIFERFYRVDKTRARRLGGAGLGLAIARSIVEAHGGRIEARSSVNTGAGGTTMTLFLPLVGSSKPMAPLRTEARQSV